MFNKNSPNSPLTSRTLVEIDPILSNGNNNNQRSSSDLSRLFHGIFHRSVKPRYPTGEREMATISTTLIKSSDTTETLPDASNNTHANDICLFSESPHYVVRV